MTREEAIEVIKRTKGAMVYTEKEKEALETLVPELAESEDEKIRKYFIWIVKNVLDNIQVLKLSEEQTRELIDNYAGIRVSDMIAYLEKQKPVDYEAELEKCKHNFIYFWDKYATVKLKTAKWSGEDEKMLQSIIEDFRAGKVSTIGQEQWLKSLPERFSLQPKQEWSEEDEKDMAHIIRILDDCYAYGKHDLSKTDHENLVNTLKSFRSQQKVEWNEEDEEIWFTLITFFKGYLQKYPPLCKDEETQVNRILSWLNTRIKSFRLHRHYKPTEDQMKALKNISYGFYQNGDGPILRELYDQLNKLM